MSKQMIVNQTVLKDGRQYPAAQKKIPSNLLIDLGDITVPAAKTGQLTTRTDNTTGTLTMTAGHGFATGNRVDIFWATGARIGVTLGTVSVNSVPFSLGSGDNLPANLTQITAVVSPSYGVALTGDNCQGLFLVAPKDTDAVFAYTLANNTLVFGVRVAKGDSYVWYVNNGVTNPLAGQTIGKLFVSHAASAAAKDLTAVTYYN